MFFILRSTVYDFAKNFLMSQKVPWCELSRNNFCVFFAFFGCSFHQPPVPTGVTPIDAAPSQPYSECYRVVLDGSMVGWIERELAPEIAQTLRRFKVCCLVWNCFLAKRPQRAVVKNRHVWNFLGLHLFYFFLIWPNKLSLAVYWYWSVLFCYFFFIHMFHLLV